MPDSPQSTAAAFSELHSIVRRLRSPNGCVWDRRQTPQSLRSNLLEETYECIDALDEQDDENLREELGDLFLLATMIAHMKEEQNVFTLAHVLRDICEKLIRRHPHVFAQAEGDSVQQVIEQWDYIKREIEGKSTNESLLHGVPRAFPPLLRAMELQKRAAKVGFDWPTIEGVWSKLREEIDELHRATAAGDVVDIEGELGDVLFTVVNLSRFLKIDPSLALHGTNEKFKRRFERIEERLQAAGSQIQNTDFAVMDEMWNRIKEEESEPDDEAETCR